MRTRLSIGMILVLGLIAASGTGSARAAGPARGHNGHVATRTPWNSAMTRPCAGAAGSRLKPTVPQRFGRFSSVQVNVDSSYANIPGDAANEPSLTMDPADPLRHGHRLAPVRQRALQFRQADTATPPTRGGIGNSPAS